MTGRAAGHRLDAGEILGASARSAVVIGDGGIRSREEQA